MALYRQVHLTFWTNPDMQDLSPEDRYFYLFLITNPLLLPGGIYLISYKDMEYYTGYSREAVKPIIERFVKLGKIKYSPETRELALKNWAKHNLQGDLMKNNQTKSVLKSMLLVKDRDLVDFVYEGHPLHTIILQQYEEKTSPLQAPSEPLASSKSNSKSNNKSKSERKSKSEESFVTPSVEKSDLVNGLMAYFGFNQMNNPDKLSKCSIFINILMNTSRADYFNQQFEAYKTYKKSTGQQVHSFPRFIGSTDEDFNDGGWNQENWVQKLAAEGGGATDIKDVKF